MSRFRSAALAVLAAVALVGAPRVLAAQQPCQGGYTVRAGDTLANIAARCGTTLPALLSVNPGVRGREDLQVGGRLRIPPPGTRPTPVEACGAFYTLRNSDSLQEVAEKCGLTVPLLLAANPALENPDAMRPGGTIRIPDLPRPGTADPVAVLPAVGNTAIIAPAAVADSAAPATPAADSAAQPEPFVRYEGVLRSGARCILLRTADGTDVGIAGGLGPGFDVGDRVVVTGPAAEAAACGTERAVQVRIMWRPRQER